ncbi:phosphoesterase [Bacillus sp. TS-2]|nr:phosphoesterase [Bacillus sp. TS-2]
MLKEIINDILEAKTIVIHRHERPDPDAIGSQLGLKTLIQSMDPKKEIYAVGDEESSLAFLGTMDQIEDEIYSDALVIILDTANQERISDKRYRLGKKVLKIDHHPDEDNYGDSNWVDTSMSSTSEMIVALIEASYIIEKGLNSEVALLLYAGIVGDTGRFLYNNTTKNTLSRAGKLVEKGFDQTHFYSQFHHKEIKIARLEGFVLQHFTFHEREGVGEMRLNKKDLEEFGVTSSESSQLVNVFSSVEGLKSWVFFVEDEEKIRVRLRSKGPIINQLAKKFNGGGHPLASGATVYSWQEADQLLFELKELSKQ